MSYQQELQVIVNKYPEIKEIKVELVNELVIRKGVVQAVELVPMPTVGGTTVRLPPELAAVINARPPKIDTFDVTEIRYQDIPPISKAKLPVTAKKAQDKDALNATLQALKRPV